eukprot:g26406.t1
MQGLQVAFSQLKVMSTNLWVLWLMAWAPSSSVGLTVPEHECIESLDLAFNNWRDCKLDTEFALPIQDNFVDKTKVRLMRLASRLRYIQQNAPNVMKDMLAWGSLRQSLLIKIVPTMERVLVEEPSTSWQDLQTFITREIAKPDSRQVEGMVEVKEAVGASATGLGRPGIQTIYIQVLGEATVKAASVDRFEASALLEALDRGSDSELAEAAAVVKSQMARVCKKNESKGFGLFATNSWTSQAYECAEIIDVDTVQDCLHYTDCVSLERTLSTAGMQVYHPAIILFVDGTGLKGGKSAYRSISFLPQQFIRYVNSSQGANATYRFFHNGVMLKSMRQHLVKCGLTQETLESILCKDLSDSGEHVSLAGKLVEVFRQGKWEQELADLLRKESTPGINSSSTRGSSSLDVARPKNAPSSSSASSSSRVGRQKTAPLSTSVSSFSKIVMQKKAPSSTSASSFAKVALQKKAASSRTSRSAPDNLLDILLQ